VTRLSARERASLPDRAFAYIDSTGRRRLPIHDAAHVRNALSRFDRVDFESDDAKDRARQRLLRAAQRHGVMPIGFITAQSRARPTGRQLPTGHVSFLMTDVEGSTLLLRRLGDDYAAVLRQMRRLVSAEVRRAGGVDVDQHGDECFAVFQRPEGALAAAVAIQRAMADSAWPQRETVRVRAGVHGGRPTLTDSGYVGLAVHTVARICSVAHGGQIVVSNQTRSACHPMPEGLTVVRLGAYQLAGLPGREELFQLAAPGLVRHFPPLRVAR
jgi:class 3 adenylate cyclase